jgi:hypothetical protein
MPPTRLAKSRRGCTFEGAGQLPAIIAAVDQEIESIELQVVIVPQMRAAEVGDTVDAEPHGFTVQHEEIDRIRSAASLIRGYLSCGRSG